MTLSNTPFLPFPKQPSSLNITHCNTGRAWVLQDTEAALGVRILRARDTLLPFLTRPYLQGARLTAWELRINLLGTYFADHGNGPGWVKAFRKDAYVIVGADRIV